MPSSQVVISGVGVVSSIGLGREPFWDALLRGRSGIRSLAERTDGDAAPVGIQPEGLAVGGPVVDFDPKQWVRPRKALKVMCREIQTTFAASQMAVEDAGLAESMPASDEALVAPAAVGTVFGSEMFYGPPSELMDAFRGCLREDGSVDGSRFGTAATRGLMPLWMLKYLPNMPACHVGIALNARGPNNTLVLGDVSGPAAVMEAASCIDRGVAEMMVSGAVGTRINGTRLNYRGDLPIGEVANPIKASSRPHDPSATGVIGGEGAAALVLESQAAASRRGARPLARILAGTSRFNASGPMRTWGRSAGLRVNPPRGSREAIEAAIEAVLELAEVRPDQVGLVISHAMGVPDLDRGEREAVRSTLGDVPVAAPIAAIGHCGAASGMLSVVTGVAAIASGTIPGTLNAATAAPEAGLLREPRRLEQPRVLCLAHTSEGSATAVLLASS